MKNIPTEIYTLKKKVVEADLDELHHVNNVQYVQWVNDIAKEHWYTRATDELKRDFFWVLVRHELDYKKQAFLGEDLIVETYVGDTTFVTSERFVNIRNAKTQEILVASKSVWCLMDTEKKRPTKITEDLRKVFHKR